MKIRRVSTDEVMVFLTNDDIAEFDIDFKNNLQRRADLHIFLSGLMEAVRIRTGFDPTVDGQVIVEAMPTMYGLRISISRPSSRFRRRKLSDRITKEQFGNIKSVRAKKYSVRNSGYGIPAESAPLDMLQRRRRNFDMQKEETTAFLFSSFEEVNDALKYMSWEDLKKSALYKNEDNYALITKLCIDDRAFNMLIEYADTYSDEDMLIYDIEEGWRKISEGEKLLEMSNAIKNID